MNRLSVVRKIHRVAHAMLQGAGYHWELRRNGEESLGLWRQKLVKNPKLRSPKRLVFIPGFADTPVSWLAVLAILKPLIKRAGYEEIILLDFPGFTGALIDQKCFPTVDQMFATTRSTLKSLKPHTVIGHSLGGWIAADYATQNFAKGTKAPEQVILVSPSGVFGSEEEKREWESRFERSMTEGFNALRKYLFVREPFWFGWLIDSMAGFTTREDVVQFMRSFRDDHTLEARLDQMRSKIWLIWGDRDELVPADWIHAWTKKLPKSHAVYLKDTGHSLQLEKPWVLAAVLGQILMDRKPHALGKTWWQLIGADGAEEAVGKASETADAAKPAAKSTSKTQRGPDLKNAAAASR